MKETKPSSFPISSAEIVVNNEDLLTKILVRIPPKPVIKLKLISKQWLSLISSDQFSHSHTRHLQNRGFQTPTALYLDFSHYEGSFELPVVALNPQIKAPILDFIDHPCFTILQSCNGLLLGHCSYKRNEEWRYFVCNSITRKFKIISVPVSQSGAFYAINLAFDPIRSPYYKIICVRVLVSPCYRFGVYIYSSKSDEWDASRISFEANEFIRFDYVVFCNGIIHWNSDDGRDSLRFDLENKLVKKMPILAPMFQAPEESEREGGRCFGESRGCLHIGVTYMPCFQFNVFEMATDYSHWFLKYCLNLDDALSTFPELRPPPVHMYNGFRILSVIRSASGESKIVIFVDYKAICYELKDGNLVNLYELKQCPGTFNLRPYNYIGIQVYHYFETLSCV